MKIINLFLASATSLIEERRELEKFISRTNDKLVGREVYLKLNIWEKESIQFNRTRKQDDFNKIVESCDFFICIIFDKVGEFTLEEFEKAHANFLSDNNPQKITVFFKDSPTKISEIQDLESVKNFQIKIKQHGQIWAYYSSTSELLLLIDKELQAIIESKKENATINQVGFYEIEFVHTTIEIFDKQAHLSKLTKFQVIKALKPFNFLYDAVSVDGDIEVSSIYVDKGISRKVSQSIKYIEVITDLGYIVDKNQKLTKTFSCTLIDSFPANEEFWEDDNVSKCGLLKTTVIFPPDRKYKAFHSKIIRGFEEIDVYGLSETFVNGKFALDIEIENQKQYDKLRTYWSW